MLHNGTNLLQTVPEGIDKEPLLMERECSNGQMGMPIASIDNDGEKGDEQDDKGEEVDDRAVFRCVAAISTGREYM